MTTRAHMLWTFAITSIALLMVSLDNLIVTMALPVIKTELNATLDGLEWTVNAYTLTFAVLLLTGAALGDRFGRRRFFLIGLSIFTVGSALAALSPDITTLILARALQGLGGAIVVPLTLTILSAAVPAERRGLALGAWGAIAGLAIALGPVVGGAIVEGLNWHSIFWVNVPIGVALLPVAALRLRETRGASDRLDLGGLVLVSGGLLGVVYGIIRGNPEGWTSLTVVGSIGVGMALLVGFVLWERRFPAPMLPLRFFRNRAFTLANVASLLMYFGMFGSIFLLSQFLQTVQGYSPLQAGLRVLPWTLAPMFVAPIAGALSDRIGGGLLMGTGLLLQGLGLAWLGIVSTPTVPYDQLVIPFIVSGIGMGLFFAPVANVVLSSVSPHEEGQASGANNAIREVGGVFGVAVLASVFSHFGGYQTGQAYLDGLRPAVLVGAAFVAVGSAAAFAIPRVRRALASNSAPLDAARPGARTPVYVTAEDQHRQVVGDQSPPSARRSPGISPGLLPATRRASGVSSPGEPVSPARRFAAGADHPRRIPRHQQVSPLGRQPATAGLHRGRAARRDLRRSALRGGPWRSTSAVAGSRHAPAARLRRR
jgi:EmrB/QacA subfamily drug resistance transporter